MALALDFLKKSDHDDDKCVDVSRYKLTFDTSIDHICIPGQRRSVWSR